MRRFAMLSTLLVSFVLLTGAVVAFADEGDAQDTSTLETTLGDDDYAMLQASIQDRGLGDDAVTSVLYDYAGEPRYIVCDTSSGYMILDRLTGIVLEWAECSSPYVAYSGAKGFYGGYGMYLIQQQDGSYLDILRQVAIDEVAHMAAIDDIDPEVFYGEGQGIPPVGEGGLTPLYTVSESTIPKAYDYIQRPSFGKNADSNANSCTAVACQVVLNYLDKRVNNSIVPAQWEAEQLTGDGWIPAYQKSTAHLSYLLNDCQLAPQYFFGETPGVYALAVANGISLYRAKAPGVQGTGISAAYNINPLSHWDFISADIDKGLPSMVTTPPWAAPPSIPTSRYAAHTLAVAGYRVDSSGARELLVHNGWYGSSNISKANDVFSHGLVHISVAAVYCSYSFKFDSGIHQGGDGMWRYFDSAGNMAYERPIRDGIYIIRPASSLSRVLDIEQASTQSLAKAIIWPSKLTSNQSFIITANSEGYYTIAPNHSAANGMVLDVEGGIAVNGAKVIQWGKNAPGNNANQLWQARPNGDGSFSFFSKMLLPGPNHPGLAMDVSGGADVNGANIVVWPYSGNSNQRFHLIPMDSGYPPMVAPSDGTVVNGTVKISMKANTNMLFDISNNSMSDGAAAILWPGNNGQNQRFYLQRQPDGYHTITSV